MKREYNKQNGLSKKARRKWKKKIWRAKKKGKKGTGRKFSLELDQATITTLIAAKTVWYLEFKSSSGLETIRKKLTIKFVEEKGAVVDLNNKPPTWVD